MSKQTLNLINNIVKNAVEKGVAKIKLENTSFDGKTVIHQNKSLISFGSYSYLGLEVDNRLKEGAIDAIDKFGLQYPSSRIYSSLPLYDHLHELFKQIFGTGVVLTTSLSLGHTGVMPIVINKNDILILDQYVHSSVQDGAEKLKSKGTAVTILRHNNLDDLENKIIHYSKKHDRIWYAIDSIYSMFGDTAPIKELEKLLNKYPKFHLYIDDAHGVSSFGKNGSGWVLSKIDLHEKLLLTTGMAKAFGTMGGVFITKNEEIFNLINNCTGSLIFSGPHPVPVIGASIASAKIHLSPEIEFKQRELQDRINYCYDLLRSEGVPDISERETPIFFVAIGKLSAGYNLVAKLKEDGFLTNIAAFPAVSESCTGVRFTISLHHTFKDIERLVLSLKKNYGLVLKEENLNFESVKRAFRKVYQFPENLSFETQESSLTLKTYSSVAQLPLEELNRLLDANSMFTTSLLLEHERAGQASNVKESDWKCYYYSVLNDQNEIICVTLFTLMLIKEDMLSDKDESIQIESIRKSNPYYLTARSLTMGISFSEGNHIYIDKNSSSKFKALDLIMEELERLSSKENVNTILLRDFKSDEIQLGNYLKNQGFLPVKMPCNHQIDTPHSFDYSFSHLPKKKRKYLRDRVTRYVDIFDCFLNEKPSKREISSFYELYLNVVNRGYELNTFPLNLDLIKNMLALKSIKLLELRDREKLVCAMLIHENKDVLHPILIGIDYTYLSMNIYSVMIWNTIMYAKKKSFKSIKLGYTASQTKRKFGAIPIESRCFYKSSDNYNQMLLNSHSASSDFIS